MRTGACDVIDALLAHGVDHLFCNLGTDHAPLIEELARRRRTGEPTPRTVLCPHENTAMHMAAGRAWATGRAQAVLVHVDVGTANAAMGMHNAARMHLPVLLFAGRAPFSTSGGMLGGRNSYINFVQEPFDQGSIVRPYVKWEYHLASGTVAAEAVARGLECAVALPAGPVYLTAARESLAEAVETQTRPVRRPPARSGAGRPEDIAELARRLVTADSPLLLTAYAGRDPEVVDLLDDLARLCGMRVVEFTPHTVNLPHDSPCHAGFAPQPWVGQCDLGILLDIDVPWVPELVQPKAGSWWAQIDSDVEKRGFPLWPFPADLRLQGHSASTLRALRAAVGALADAAWLDKARGRLARLAQERVERSGAAERAAAFAGEAGRLGAAHVCARLGHLLEPDDILLNEGVRNAGIVFEQIARSRPGTRVGPAGGGLGWSSGMALGIRLARPSALVVSVVGDGAAYFGNPQSTLAVAMRHGLPTLTVVLDNGGWSAVKEATLKMYPHGEANEQSAWEADLGRQTDFAMVARAAGAEGFRLRAPGDVQPILAQAVDVVRGGRPAVVHVDIASF